MEKNKENPEFVACVREPEICQEHLIRTWLIRLIAWDGLLPAAVWATPALVRLLIPNNRGVIEITAIILPIIAFFVRYRVGRQYISSNRCSAIVQRFQTTVFCVGITLLVLVDAFMVLACLMPKGAGLTNTDLIVWAIIFTIYLISMATAMYPGFDRK